MEEDYEVKQLFPKYRFLIGLLICYSVMAATFSKSIPSPLLTRISNEFQMDVTVCGYLSTATTLMMGIALLFGTSLLEKLGGKKTFLVANLIIFIGEVLSYIAPGFLILVIGRGLVGAGLGIAISYFSYATNTWFPPKERSIYITIYMLSGTAITFVCYAVILPLTERLNGIWRNDFGVMALISLSASLLWLAFGKNNEAYEVYQKQKEPEQKEMGKRTNGIWQAMKRKDVWILTGFVATSNLVATAITTYLPSFLELFRNFSSEKASTLTGLISLAGAIGTLVGGVITTGSSKRKPLYIISTIISALSLFIVLYVRIPVVIAIAILVYGFASMIKNTACHLQIMHMKDMSVIVSSGAYSLMMSVGYFTGFFVPSLLKGLEQQVGMENAMQILDVALLISLLFVWRMKGEKN